MSKFDMRGHKIAIFLLFTTFLISSFMAILITNEPPSAKISNSAVDPHTSNSFQEGWQQNGMVVCNATGNQWNPVFCDVGDGIIYVWVDLRNGERDIYAQKIFLNGTIAWAGHSPNGTVICNASGDQDIPRLISDGQGGAIITWQDSREGGSSIDIYAQRVNSSGYTNWKDNGTVICNADSTQRSPELCSDGQGGAIITWQDFRSSSPSYDDIYAQRINSTGHTQWTANGTAVAVYTSYQFYPKILSDGLGGAIITWQDRRQSSFKIYAQRLNSDGSPNWTVNGVRLTSYNSYDFEYPEICSDEDHGAIIIWREFISDHGYDTYGQRILSNGTTVWGNFGKPIADTSGANNNQYSGKVCPDGMGGAIIAYMDCAATDADDNVKIQRVNSTGDKQWSESGVWLCDAVDDQLSIRLCSDGANGAVVLWADNRFKATMNYEVYGQRVNSTGHIIWQEDGMLIASGPNNQYYQDILTTGEGDFYIVWGNETNDGTYDVLTQFYPNYAPQSDHPDNVFTTSLGAETINWTIVDDGPKGQYRVLSNNSLGDIYVWIDWTSWINNTKLYVPINRTYSGEYNYTIEYIDEFGRYGSTDSVLVIIENTVPICNEIDPIITYLNGSETINWTISDDDPQGQYRILSNNTFGDTYIWVDWSMWSNGAQLHIPINRTAPGRFNYTIEYYDDSIQYGILRSVIVTIMNGMPAISAPNSFDTQIYTSDIIGCIIYDDGPSGQYRVLANNSLGDTYIWVDWTEWTSGNQFTIPINRTVPGLFNYSVEYYDGLAQFGDSREIIVNLTNGIPSSNDLSLLSSNIYTSDTLTWTISDDGPSGQYRVLANNSLGDTYVWVDWTGWASDISFNIPINRSLPGVFHYILEYHDEFSQVGISDMLVVELTNEIPTINDLTEIQTTLDENTNISWIITDDGPSGQYRVLANNSFGDIYTWVDWTEWTSGNQIKIPINRTITGCFSYTLEFFDEFNEFGVSEEILIIITEANEDNANNNDDNADDSPDDDENNSQVPIISFGLTFLIFIGIGILCKTSLKFQRRN